ncbi:MOSC and FAD-binding oxidoreductase domain-containing protein [Paludibaculum fermentans]|uniref:nitric oxide dioxygenase n=1 Tax=Paludibaculum fermentans TaxID=1473598 RepID=A0A7S7NSE5_PALFE|nr:MOSC and FAD-binding oxidoreductase domain-containing protein [Paludibaculum fermentans]QOY88967.1 MOSC domain-containing protein [Paludibaculum fermentans]
MGTLVSVNVGLPRDIEWKEQTVRTAIWKQPVQGRIAVGRLNLAGDGQGDLAGHGGEHRAVMVYQLDSYRYWEAHLGRHAFPYGQFGENFTISGLPDHEVCIGDQYRIGSALFEVTQPRVTCYRVGIRLEEPAMAALLVSHHRPGFYFRVLREGDVGAGDEIVKVADGPERMTVAELDALLYLPNPSRDQLERALRIPALSAGWKGSFQALLQPNSSQGGNPGLKASAGPPPAWPGFRPMRVVRLDRETANVVSIALQPPDGTSLPPALPGQYLVLRLRTTTGGALLLRNYSMSGTPGGGAYRISVKREAHGVVSSYLHEHLRAGDLLEVSAPRGGFTLASGGGPVVFLSAGIGATPVLAMLHSLSSQASGREVWWIYGARNAAEHPFAKESRELLHTLGNARTHVVYSRPGSEDKPGSDYDSVGHVDTQLLNSLGVPREADFYLCGPPVFMNQLTQGLQTWAVDPARVHTESFGPEQSITPGIAPSPQLPPLPPEGKPGTGPSISFVRSGLTVPWDSRFSSLLELAEACSVPVQWSCRTGVCHTCECPLIGGSVQYQPDPLQPPAPGDVLICCSTPLANIEIDL